MSVTRGYIRERIKRVVNSCTSKEQLNAAARYAVLMLQREGGGWWRNRGIDREVWTELSVYANAVITTKCLELKEQGMCHNLFARTIDAIIQENHRWFKQ